MDSLRVFKAIGMALRNPNGVIDPPRATVVPQEAEAEALGSYVAEPLQAWGVYAGKEGSTDKTGVTMATLRAFSYRMTPTNAILSTRVNQASRFCQRHTSSRYGLVEEASFRVRLRDRNATPSPQDQANISAWEEFFEMGGWCPPPEQDRPVGWRPGLDYIIKAMVRDTFVTDFIPLKTFAQVGAEKQFPVVSMCLDDGAQYRNVVGTKELQPDGTFKIVPYVPERSNLGKRHVSLVRLMGDGSFLPLAEYTRGEVSMFVRNVRVDDNIFGYGFPETEQAIDSLTTTLEIRRYNLDRFRKDRLPRGFFHLQGKVSPTARSVFENRISQMLTNKAWSIPILQTDPPNVVGSAGTQIQWVDINQAMKDGEYSQLAFAMLNELHAAYHISMEETGLSEANPFSGGLSEASPESALKHSQSHFGNLMMDLAGFFNTNVLWRSPGGKRYVFEWVGLGDRDYMEEEELAGAMLQNGTITLRMLYKYRDVPLPRSIANSPAVDLPMPFAQSLQYLDQKEAEAMQNEVAQKQQADQEAQSEAQARIQRRQSGMGASGGEDRPSAIPEMPSPVQPPSQVDSMGAPQQIRISRTPAPPEAS
jgi:hypothetical protein